MSGPGDVAVSAVQPNPLSLPTYPPNVTGIFGARVVAANVATGAVIAGTLGGWSCQSPGPAKFHGTYAINYLPSEAHIPFMRSRSTESSRPRMLCPR